MLRKRSIQLALLAVILIAAVMAVVFQKDIRIAYHKNRLLTAGRYYQLANPSMNATPAPRPNKFEELALILGRGRYTDETDRMKFHTKTLTKLGYFVEQEFPLNNRLYDGTNRLVFHQLLTDRFNFGKAAVVTNDWWDLTGTESNKIVVTTTKTLMPKWEKLVKDFDHP